MTVRVSIVVPVYNEGAEVVAFLDRVVNSVAMPFELLAVYDDESDTTLPYLQEYNARDERVRPVLNAVSPGPAGALSAGFAAAKADVVVVTMADGSDDPAQIETLTKLVERGVVVAAASRYMHGGQQVGGPWFKGFLSKMAGLSLFWVARVGTHDATNSFKAYSASFVEEVGIDSDAGFELGIEMVATARRARRPVAEIPTIWLDRDHGTSNFKLIEWLPTYLRWYRHAFIGGSK
ncbi:MAG: glycosyltransferase family 2 protein [Actinomycetota bacterium]